MAHQPASPDGAPYTVTLRESLPLIPSPSQTSMGSGTFDLRKVQTLTVNDPAALPIADRFRADLHAWTEVDVPAAVVAAGRTSGSVHVELAREDGTPPDPLSPGSRAASGVHRLLIDGDGVQVRADQEEGLYRGLTSVVQLAGVGGPSLPHVEVNDRARFGWRGLSLDVVRCFIPIEEVKRVIDLLALYKFSVLHLHLTDNEGWRIEIRSRPRLTAATAQSEAGGRTYYTQEEYTDLVRYARQRFITVVPEIDLPGHAGAVLRAYPQLGAGEVSLESPIPIANVDGSSEATWTFVEDVLRELAAVTPGPYLHIGGDEAFGMDDEAHARFVSRVARAVQSLGKTAVGWQEASRGDVGPDQILQHWIDFTSSNPDEDSAGEEAGSGAAGALRLPPEVLEMLRENFGKSAGDLERIADKGARLLLSPAKHAYLDRPHAESSRNERQELVRGRLGLPVYPPTPLSDYLEWNPLDIAHSIAPDRVLGVEAAVWGETVTGVEDLEVLLLPRLPAIAEVAWSPAESQGWPEYRARLARHALLWSRRAWNWYEADSVDWALA
jgi:hexosaminidase